MGSRTSPLTAGREVGKLAACRPPDLGTPSALTWPETRGEAHVAEGAPHARPWADSGVGNTETSFGRRAP